MDLRHLRYFVAIVEEGGFSEAARNRLHTSQPSLSRQMRELEAELGVVLLDRGVQGATPTAAGLTLLDHARQILAQVQQANDATRNSKRLMRVGCLPGLEEDVLKRLHKATACQPEALAFQVLGSTSPALREDMRAGLLDIAFVWPDEDESDFHSMVFRNEETMAVVPAAHPLCGSTALCFEALRHETCIAMSPKVAPGFSSTIQSWARHRDLTLTPAHLAGNLTSAMSLVHATGGFLLIPEFIAAFVPAEFVVLKFTKPRPVVPICLIYRPANRSSVGWIAQNIMDQRTERRQSLNTQRG